MQEKLVFPNAVLEGFLRYVSPHKEAYAQFIQSLGVDESWLMNKCNWHTMSFYEHFFECLFKHFPEQKDVAFHGARFLYNQKKFQQFTAIAGLMLTPDRVLGQLVKSSATMNRYNTYEYQIIFKNNLYTKVRLIQRYDEPSREINRLLCDSSRGSMEGVCEYLGYRLVSIRETVCVKRGDDHCEYEITWINRPSIKLAFLWLGLAASIWLVLGFLHLHTLVQTGIALLASTLVISLHGNFKHRRRLEEAFEYQADLLNDLSNKFQETLHLNKQLMNYQKQVNEALVLASIGEFSFRWFHELATPISVIRLSSEEIAREQSEPEPDREKLARLCAYIERGSKRVSDIITFCRAAVKGSAPDLVTFALGKTVRETLDFVEPLCRRAGVQLSFVEPPEEIRVTNFRGYLENVLLNLIQNSIKAMGRKGADSEHVIRVEIQRILEDSLRLSVCDNGPGLPESMHADPWARFGAQDPNDSGSSGYGLYSVSQFVEKMGGAIALRKDVAVGAIFDITLPQSISEAAAEAGQTAPHPA